MQLSAQQASRGPRRRAVLTALTAAVAVPAVSVIAACAPTPTATNEVYNRPASGVFTLTGHGWGHGRGMSQWGAEGAASLGISSGTIVSTYYPGTQATVLRNSGLRVKLSATSGSELQVLPATGLTVTDGAGHRSTPTNPASRWRILADGTGQHLQRLVSNSWSPVPVAGAYNLTSPVRFSSSANIVSVVFPSLYSRDYRGSVSSIVTSPGHVVNVNNTTMEDYLRGVVPQEVSPSWHPAALQAQAIAARTYAAQQRASGAWGSLYDICDSSACQAYGGVRLRSPSGYVTPVEYPQTDAAVAATAGSIRTYNGKPAFTQFSSSNGGFSVDGGYPYLVAKADPWDGAVANPMHTWTAKLPVSTLEARYPAVGKLLRLKVTKRDGGGEWGGRVLTVVLEGVDRYGHPTSVTTSGDSIYYARAFGSYSDGLRSNWWKVTG